MKKNILIILFVVINFSIYAKPDSGLFFSLGAGYANIESETIINYFGDAENIDESSKAYSFDLKVGIAISRVLLFANCKTFLNDSYKLEDFEEETATLSLIGVGLSYYLNEKTYITGSLGFSYIKILSNSDSNKLADDYSGPAVYLGLGYNLSNNLSLEFGYSEFDIKAKYELYEVSTVNRCLGLSVNMVIN